MAFLDLLLPRRKHDPAHSRAETGPRVDWPARRIEPATDRGDLAISDKQRQVLRQLSAHVRQRRSEEHTSELQSLMRISYAVFCLKKKNKTKINTQKTYKKTRTIHSLQNTHKTTK